MATRSQLAILSIVLLVFLAWASPQAEAQRNRAAANAGRAIRKGSTSIGKVPSVRAAQALGDLGRAAGRRQASPFPLLDAISRAGGGRNPVGTSPFPVLDAISRANGGRGVSNSTPFPILDAISRANGGNGTGYSTPFPILESIARANSDSYNKGHSPTPQDLLYGLAQLGASGGYGYPGYGPGYGANPYPYYDSYYRHKSDEDYADAMRDAAIAGAVSNVVSAIVSSPSVRTQPPAYVQTAPVYTQPAPVYAQPAPVYAQPAPAQAYVQPSPLGRYETRREVVGGGYYERDQVWIPESRDPQTGNIVEGHYANVKRWVPEVVQETRVWVAP